MKVLCLIDYDKKSKNNFKRYLDKNIMVEFISKNKLSSIKKYNDYDIVIGHRLDINYFKKFKNLKYYIIPFAGIPNKDKRNLRKLNDITLINSHFNSLFVAEHAWALLLSLVKKVVSAHNNFKNGDWSYRYNDNQSSVLDSKNLLLAGYGAIGKKIEKFAKSFDMNTYAVRRKVSDKKYIYSNHEMKYILPKIDIIISSLPATRETINFFSFKEFDLLKEGSYIINVGRGEVISQKALYSFMKNGKIKGAAIDTWWNYPQNKKSRKKTFPADYPFNEFENFIFSPHRASHVENIEKYRIQDLTRILNSIYEGKIINEVDINRGY